MAGFGTDAVALATIVGAAVVGGVVTSATLGALDASENSSHFVFSTEFADSDHANVDHEIQIWDGNASEAIVVGQSRRGNREMRRRRRRHRHPHGLNQARIERIQSQREVRTRVRHRIKAEMNEARAAIEANAAQVEAQAAQMEAQAAEIEAAMEMGEKAEQKRNNR